MKPTMKLKVTEFVVELEVQAVTCPGVWLCTNGKVTLHLYMLGTCTQTYSVNPVFPLLFHEKFTFRKTFHKVLKLSELQKVLAKEFLYIELVQWEDCECPNVLASFRTTVSELLYPLPHSDCIMAGVDVDLLMEGTQNFPGIISPKVEISTKTTIAEVLRPLSKKSNETMVVNPKVISTNYIPKRKIPVRQRRVCHSYGYHKLKASKRSPETIAANKKKTPNDTEFKKEATGSPRDKIDWEIRKHKESAEEEIIKNIKKCTAKTEGKCLCHTRNRTVTCKLCTKYNHYFGNICCSCKDQFSESPEINFCDCVRRHENEKNKNRRPESPKSYVYNTRTRPVVDRKKNIQLRSPRTGGCKCKKKNETQSNEIRKDDMRESGDRKFTYMNIPDVTPLSSNRSSLAMELHKRLEKTLGNQNQNCKCCLKSPNQVTARDEYDEGALNKEPSNGKFYKKLSDFYIELSKRAQRKSKLEL